MPQPASKSSVVGRGAQEQPHNRFERVRAEADFEHLEHDDVDVADRRRLATEFLPDDSRSLISENNSPDIPFRWSLNPYRGCEHGCAYCYARPTHEYLGLSAGLDFESKIFVKYQAADLLREELSRPKWRGEPIALSGVTDCYQPVERRLRLTRACLEVMREARQPVMIVTKNALVARDLDLLSEMASRKTADVSVSLTTLDAGLARVLEPRTSSPPARLRAITELTSGGVPVRAMIAPIIPGLNDQEIPNLLRAAAEAGAAAASYILLRLPHAVLPIMRQWLERNRPEAAPRIEAMIRSTRDGRMNSAQFGERMRGRGSYAEQISQVFNVFRQKTGFDRALPALDSSRFTRPRPKNGQLRLF